MPGDDLTRGRVTGVREKPTRRPTARVHCKDRLGAHLRKRPALAQAVQAAKTRNCPFSMGARRPVISKERVRGEPPRPGQVTLETWIRVALFGESATTFRNARPCMAGDGAGSARPTRSVPAAVAVQTQVAPATLRTRRVPYMLAHPRRSPPGGVAPNDMDFSGERSESAARTG